MNMLLDYENPVLYKLQANMKWKQSNALLCRSKRADVFEEEQEVLYLNKETG